MRVACCVLRVACCVRRYASQQLGCSFPPDSLRWSWSMRCANSISRWASPSIHCSPPCRGLRGKLKDLRTRLRSHSPYFGDWIVSLPEQPLLHLVELGTEPLACRLSFHYEAPVPALRVRCPAGTNISARFPGHVASSGGRAGTGVD